MKIRSLLFLLCWMSLSTPRTHAVNPTSKASEPSKFEAEKALPTEPLTKQARSQRSAAATTWHRTRLRAAYERAGTKNPKWNESMVELLDEVALLRGGNELRDPNRVKELVRQVDQLGCTDPLFRYLLLRYGDLPMKQEDVAPAFRAASQALRDSDYDSLEKFWATLRTASTVKAEVGKKVSLELANLRRTAVDLLADALANPQVPPGEVVVTVDGILTALNVNRQEYHLAWDKLIPRVLNHWPTDPQVLLTVGRGHLDRAWMARGGGFANTVTEDGWKGFAAELELAEKYLTNSWALGALNGTANQMLRLELGQGEGRERMELWFARALELNPSDYDSCADKLWYLMPRWHGDHDQMLEFGRSCLTHPRWKGQVPLALMRAHELIATDLPKEKRPAYWRKKAVWSDVQKSFDRFFELNPKNVSWRHNYAMYAWKAGDWDELNRQIPLLGEINYSYFGGKEEFDRLLSEAKARDGTGPK